MTADESYDPKATSFDSERGNIVIESDAPRDLLASLTKTDDAEARDAMAKAEISETRIDDTWHRRDDIQAFWGGAGVTWGGGICSAGYAARNAVLPQMTALALSMGSIVAGSILVEYIFAYPGTGYLLYQGIINSDYTLIQGVVFVLITATSLAVLMIDLLYPILDPRITYQKR